MEWQRRSSYFILTVFLGLLLTACGNFTASLNTTSATVAPNSSTPLILTLTPKPLAGGTFTLTTAGAPAGMTLSPGTLTLPASKAPVTQTLTLQVGASVPAGSYPLTIKITSDGITQTLTLNVSVIAPGAQLWLKEFGSDWAFVRGVGTDAAGNVYAGGIETTNTGNAIGQFLAELDSNGNVLWVKHMAVLPPNGNLPIAPEIVIYDHQGNSLMLSGITLLKSDAAGNQVWIQNYDGGNYLKGAVMDAQGNITIGGMTSGYNVNVIAPRSTETPFVARLNSNGDIVWKQYLPTTGVCTFLCRVSSVALDNSGNVVVGGYTTAAFAGFVENQVVVDTSNPPLTGDGFVAKLDGNGNPLWLQQFGTSTDEEILSVAVDTHGNIFAGGETAGTFPGQAPGSGNNLLLKFDANGNQQWLKQFGGATTNSNTFNVAVDHAGRVITSGFGLALENPPSTASIVVQAQIFKFDTNGQLLWQKDVRPVQFRGMALDDNDNILAGGAEYTTAAYPYTDMYPVVGKFTP